MSPPEVWGPPVWALLHTLAEKLNESHIQHRVIKGDLFKFIKRICAFLPCPECSKDATLFLNRVKPSDIQTKQQLINMLYLFHNHVNVKKRKGLFNYENLNQYKTQNIIYVLNNFANAYNTNGNMKLLSDSFQRKRILSDFKNWILTNNSGFINEPVRESIPTDNINVAPVFVSDVPVKENITFDIIID